MTGDRPGVRWYGKDAGMRETLRDFMIGVSATAALFASFQSWNTGRVLSAEIADLREEVGELRGALETTSDTVIAHLNAPGMHGARSLPSSAEAPLEAPRR